MGVTVTVLRAVGTQPEMQTLMMDGWHDWVTVLEEKGKIKLAGRCVRFRDKIRFISVWGSVSLLVWLYGETDFSLKKPRKATQCSKKPPPQKTLQLGVVVGVWRAVDVWTVALITDETLKGIVLYPSTWSEYTRVWTLSLYRCSRRASIFKCSEICGRPQRRTGWWNESYSVGGRWLNISERKLPGKKPEEGCIN